MVICGLRKPVRAASERLKRKSRYSAACEEGGLNNNICKQESNAVAIDASPENHRRLSGRVTSESGLSISGG